MNKLRSLKAVSRTRLLLLSSVMALTLGVSVYLNTSHSFASSPVQEPPVFGETWARTELFFGAARPDGSMIADDKFKRFLDQQITPRFPNGLIVLTGSGQFKGVNGVIVQEKSRLLILLYPLTDADASNRIEAIRAIYNETFQQESVLRVDSRVGVSF